MKRKRLYFSAKIILRRGQIWNFPNESNRQKIDTKFPSLVSLSPFFKCKHPSAERWCLRAKFQIPPFHRRIFVINTTIRMVFEPNTTEKNVVFDWKTMFLSSNTTFFCGFLPKFWNFEALGWVESGVTMESDYIEERKNKRLWKSLSFAFLCKVEIVHRLHPSVNTNQFCSRKNNFCALFFPPCPKIIFNGPLVGSQLCRYLLSTFELLRYLFF